MQYSSSSSSRKFSAVFVNSLHKATLQIFYYTTHTAPRAQSHRKPQWNLTCESSYLGRFTRLCYTMLRFSMNREFLILTRKSKARVSIVFNYITLFLLMTHGRVCVDFANCFSRSALPLNQWVLTICIKISPLGLAFEWKLHCFSLVEEAILSTLSG